MLALLIILICLLLNAWFAAVEIAFVSTSRPFLKELERRGDLHAKRILALRNNPERTLSVLQVGITLVGAIAAAVGGAGAAEVIRPYLMEVFHLGKTLSQFLSLTFVILVYSYFSVLIGELLPKTFALKNPLKVVYFSLRWLLLLDRLLTPFVVVLEYSTRFGLKLLRPFFGKEEASGEAIDLSYLSREHRQYMVNLFNIENKTVRDAMVPWSSALVLDKKLSAQEVEPHVIASGHTRIPVMEEGRVVGLLHTKEFIALAHSGYKEWQSIIRPHVALKGADSLIDSLRLMQEKRCHLGVVYEQEKPVGIITIEDILEEIVGDIYDEDDDGMIKKIIAGRAAFDAFNVQERDR